MTTRPTFKYHPNLYESNLIEQGPDTCQCCGATVSEYYNRMYCQASIDCLCLGCMASGAAAEKFDGIFIQDADEAKVDDSAKVDELFKRTPGYSSWQGEYWLAATTFVPLSAMWARRSWRIWGSRTKFLPNTMP